LPSTGHSTKTDRSVKAMSWPQYTEHTKQHIRLCRVSVRLTRDSSQSLRYGI